LSTGGGESVAAVASGMLEDHVAVEFVDDVVDLDPVVLVFADTLEIDIEVLGDGYLVRVGINHGDFYFVEIVSNLDSITW
jgi:hypothetical protein